MHQIWVDNQKVQKVSPFDRGLAYGDGLFATMRVENRSILFLDTHLQRLIDGAYRLGFDWQLTQTLRDELNVLADKQVTGCIKLLLTRGEGGRGYQSPAKPSPMLIVSLHALPQTYQKWRKSGAKLASSDVPLASQPLLAGIKHLNRLEQVLIKSSGLLLGFDDWLVSNSQGNVIESSVGNLFFISGTDVYTPKITESGVSGVMRQQVIEALLTKGFNVFCTDISQASIQQYKHVVMTNSLYGIIDITAIDNHSFDRFELTQPLLISLGFC